MTTKIPIIRDQVNVITLKCAQDWHNAFKDQNCNGFAAGDMPNSIVIPFADIEQIVHDFRESVKENVNGVRIYFIIKPTKKVAGQPNISVICVPTTGPFDNITDVDPKKRYKDKIIKATLKKGGQKNHDSDGGAKVSKTLALSDSDSGYVSIYDVTRPCPPYCDPDSPINGEG